MEIKKSINGSTLDVEIIGKVDTNTSVQLREEVADKLDGITDLKLNLQNTAYISSAGLRVLLACQKTMDDRGNMTLYNVKPEILKILKSTGMLELLNVQQ